MDIAIGFIQVLVMCVLGWIFNKRLAKIAIDNSKELANQNAILQRNNSQALEEFKNTELIRQENLKRCEDFLILIHNIINHFATLLFKLNFKENFPKSQHENITFAEISEGILLSSDDKSKCIMYLTFYFPHFTMLEKAPDSMDSHMEIIKFHLKQHQIIAHEIIAESKKYINP